MSHVQQMISICKCTLHQKAHSNTELLRTTSTEVLASVIQGKATINIQVLFNQPYLSRIFQNMKSQ